MKTVMKMTREVLDYLTKCPMCLLVYFGHTWCEICDMGTISLNYHEQKEDPYWKDDEYE